jgi:hypothetical protein
MSAEAEEKFLDTVYTYRLADEENRKKRFHDIDIQRFQEIIIDLDAVIPGLKGIVLGRALVLKACCFYWILLGREAKENTKFWQGPNPNHESLRSQGLQFALKGRDIFINEEAEDYDISWADDTVEKLGS